MGGRRVRFLLVISISIIFLMAHNARSQSRSTSAEKSAAKEGAVPAKSAARKLLPAANAWVETTLRKMTVDEKIGQLLFTTYHGSLTATDTAAYQQIMHDVADLRVGGFINITHGSPLGVGAAVDRHDSRRQHQRPQDTIHHAVSGMVDNSVWGGAGCGWCADEWGRAVWHHRLTYTAVWGLHEGTALRPTGTAHAKVATAVRIAHATGCSSDQSRRTGSPGAYSRSLRPCSGLRLQCSRVPVQSPCPRVSVGSVPLRDGHRLQRHRIM